MLEFSAAPSSVILPYTFVQNEFVNDKKISQGEKEIIQKGLALAIINNLKT